MLHITHIHTGAAHAHASWIQRSITNDGIPLTGRKEAGTLLPGDGIGPHEMTGTTVEPLYNGHHWDCYRGPLYGNIFSSDIE